MKVLITGADGMLGSNLVRKLIERKIKVSAFLFIYTKANTLNNLNIKRYYGDITVPETLDQAFKENDIVIHAAASTSIWPTISKDISNINITGTRNIIDKAIQYKIKKLIYIGSASSLNLIDKKLISKPQPHSESDYVGSKFHALTLIEKAINENQLPATIIHPTFMIGPYDSKPSSGKLILKLANGSIKFYTGGGKNFVHVKDVVNAIINCLGNETNGNSYIIGNENLTYNEFFNLVSDVIGCKRPKYFMPGLGVKIAGMIWQLFATLLKKEPLLSYKSACISCKKQFLNSRISTKELNLNSTPVRIAVQDCFNWFMENNYIEHNKNARVV